ncbi:unnamed protein product [Amoebophrya sp. A120]|nr:unnamed protein product [Amoebophrya sp. A120]|eukprot:GSA120T00019217001.1
MASAPGVVVLGAASSAGGPPAAAAAPGTLATSTGGAPLQSFELSEAELSHLVNLARDQDAAFKAFLRAGGAESRFAQDELGPAQGQVDLARPNRPVRDLMGARASSADLQEEASCRSTTSTRAIHPSSSNTLPPHASSSSGGNIVDQPPFGGYALQLLYLRFKEHQKWSQQQARAGSCGSIGTKSKFGKTSSKSSLLSTQELSAARKRSASTTSPATAGRPGPESEAEVDSPASRASYEGGAASINMDVEGVTRASGNEGRLGAAASFSLDEEASKNGREKLQLPWVLKMLVRRRASSEDVLGQRRSHQPAEVPEGADESVLNKSKAAEARRGRAEEQTEVAELLRAERFLTEVESLTKEEGQHLARPRSRPGPSAYEQQYFIPLYNKWTSSINSAATSSRDAASGAFPPSHGASCDAKQTQHSKRLPITDKPVPASVYAVRSRATVPQNI